MTWNIEGFKRNIFNLKELLNREAPQIIFLSETQVYSSDVANLMTYFQGEYCVHSNSEDCFNLDLPLLKSRATGGTLTMWRKELDPFITVHPSPSSAILPLIFHPQGYAVSIHVNVYLPTQGREAEFMEDMSKLSALIEELVDKYTNAALYIRGDFNVNDNNLKRKQLFKYFLETHNLIELHIGHATYHHFVGDGASDSRLDRILYSCGPNTPEKLENIICKLEEPLVTSLHDVIISHWEPLAEEKEVSLTSNLVAPRVPNERHKTIWSEEGVELYQHLLSSHLQRLQDMWLNAPTKTSLSLLSSATNHILTKCASLSNKTCSLSASTKKRSQSVPHQVMVSSRRLRREYSKLRSAKHNHPADSPVVLQMQKQYSEHRSSHRKLLRAIQAREAINRDSNLLNNPASTFAKIRASRRATAGKIHELKVGSLKFVGDRVRDGFYTSVNYLKSRNKELLDGSANFQCIKNDYQNILKLSKDSRDIEPISELQSLHILENMKADVNDLYSVTPNHYLYAGPAGVRHFFLLLNAFLQNVNSTSIEEINATYACILFKGHGKEKSSARSYRTISTCPVVAKGLDLYLRSLHEEKWNDDRVDTQFQGKDSSHELAAILLTECILYSNSTLKLPTFALYLDAMSAFDVVLKEILIKNLFFTQGLDKSLLLVDSRLDNRVTYVDWDGCMMGPIHDEQGLEQGGTNSSEYYKIFGKEQLDSAQRSKLGIWIGKNICVSAIGQADDTVLVSNDINNLLLLLQLTITYCERHFVDLCAEKTRLQVFLPHSHQNFLETTYNPIKINGKTIDFSATAEHVGILRSTDGNHPSIMARFSAHRRSIAAILHCGLARNQLGNPASGLQLHALYGTPVLFSGLAPLYLSLSEIDLIEKHFKDTLLGLQRLYQKTPRSVVYFLGGSLPGQALLHSRQLCLFGMIARLPGSILHQHALDFFSSKTISKKSWFHQVRDCCMLYGLPHPLDLLSYPIPKDQFKLYVKKKILSYWEIQLRDEAAALPSLKFFHAEYMSLKKPHPIWLTAGSSPAKVRKATIQARMLSGRYRTEALCRHWCTTNRKGVCLMSPECSETLEDMEHILQHCPALNDTRRYLLNYTEAYVSKLPLPVADLISSHCSPSSSFYCQFLLDCSSLPSVIALLQEHGSSFLYDLFEVSRTWVFAIHRDRLRCLNRWVPGKRLM